MHNTVYSSLRLNSLNGIQPQFAIFRLRRKIIADFPQRAIHKTVVNNLRNKLSKIISKEDNGPTLVGKILMIVGVIISTILYGIFFGWIFFLIGIIFIWFSELSKTEKWLWTLVPSLIWIPMMILFSILLPMIYYSIVNA